MKNTPAFVLMTVILCAGCATQYDMKLTNGMIITARGKPRVDEKTHVVYFTDAKGRTNAVPEFRIVEIAPHSRMAEEDDTKKFKSVTKQ
jgi:Bacterial protein of unknown function (DUF903)